MKVKFRKGLCEGVWFLWPVVIYYACLGIEVRFLKWFVGIDWKWRGIDIEEELKEIKPEPTCLGLQDIIEE